MTSIRKRMQQEKKSFQEQLNEFNSGNRDDYDDYLDFWGEIDESDDYESLYEMDLYDDWDDYYDDPNNTYDDYFEDYFEHLDWLYDDDIGHQYPYSPGNHIEDLKTHEKYIVTVDYSLVNLLTGEFKYNMENDFVILMK